MKILFYSLFFIPTLAVSAENLEERISALEQRVSELEQALEILDSPISISPETISISPGTYFLDTDIIPSSAEEKMRFSIYHVMTTVRSNDYEYSIQFGAGREGLINWQFYVDYNNDGVVDMGMIEEFLSSLPLIGMLSRSVDPVASQNIYNLFIENVDIASFTPPEAISENANTINRQIWEYIQEQSAAMAEWIRQQ